MTTTEIYTLSLHDALPILSRRRCGFGNIVIVASTTASILRTVFSILATCCAKSPRSEEHTSELQSQSKLVCRLLLEKKNDLHLDDVACPSVAALAISTLRA